MCVEEQCKTCRWFFVIKDSMKWPIPFTEEEEEEMNFLGTCRRRAPIALQGNARAFALVTKSFHCGDWEEKK